MLPQKIRLSSVGLYEDAENLLTQIFRRPIILAASVTHGHLSNLPVLVGDIWCCNSGSSVHATVQMAANQLRLRGIKVEMIRHSNMSMLESRIRKLKDPLKRFGTWQWHLLDVWRFCSHWWVEATAGQIRTISIFTLMMLMVQVFLEKMVVVRTQISPISWTHVPHSGAGKSFAGAGVSGLSWWRE